jgi:hypothetical protein
MMEIKNVLAFVHLIPSMQILSQELVLMNVIFQMDISEIIQMVGAFYNA